MPPVFTPEEWLKKKAAYEAFSRWEEQQSLFPDISSAMAWWEDVLILYRQLYPDDPPLDLGKYERLAQTRNALSFLR